MVRKLPKDPKIMPNMAANTLNLAENSKKTLDDSNSEFIFYIIVRFC